MNHNQQYRATFFKKALSDANILKFSGGMQQKIIIARWLLARPRLLILDEPTRGVDIETRAAIYSALSALAEQGTAIVVISSDFEELLGVSHRVVVLSDGRSVASVPASCLNTERLTMLSAPRRSAHVISATLAALAALARRWSAGCMWLYHDDEYVFCLDSAGSEYAAQTMQREAVAPLSSTPLGKADVAGMRVATLRGRQGQAMGSIVLISDDPGRLPEISDLDQIITQSLYKSEGIAA